MAMSEQVQVQKFVTFSLKLRKSQLILKGHMMLFQDFPRVCVDDKFKDFQVVEKW